MDVRFADLGESTTDGTGWVELGLGLIRSNDGTQYMKIVLFISEQIFPPSVSCISLRAHGFSLIHQMLLAAVCVSHLQILIAFV